MQRLTYRDAERVLRLGKRWQGLLRVGHAACPYGHRINRDRNRLEEDTYRCQHRTQERHAPCNTLLFVLAEWKARDGGSLELCYAVEVTSEEVEQMRRRRMSTDEKITYLGCAWGEVVPAATLTA